MKQNEKVEQNFFKCEKENNHTSMTKKKTTEKKERVNDFDIPKGDSEQRQKHLETRSDQHALVEVGCEIE